MRRGRGFLENASTSIAQRDHSIPILRAHRPVKAAGDIEPIIARLALQTPQPAQAHSPHTHKKVL
jgi:hypothetical protein